MKNKLIFLTIVVSSFLGGMGCGKRIRPDASLPATESNYQTSEFYACGHHFLGMGGCTLEAGQSISTVDLKVMGFHKGTIRVFSESLGIDVGLSYEGSMPHPISLGNKIPTHGALIGFTVNPHFPDEENQAVEIHGTQGFVWVSVAGTEGAGVWSHHQTQVPEDVHGVMEVPVADADQFYVDGDCMDAQTFVPSGPTHTFSSGDLGQKTPGIDVCTYFIFGLSHTKEIKHARAWNVSRYKKGFVPLPLPSLMVDGDEITVKAHEAVAAVALDRVFEIDHQGTFEWDPLRHPQTVRLLTVKGRAVIGDWDGRGFQWKR